MNRKVSQILHGQTGLTESVYIFAEIFLQLETGSLKIADIFTHIAYWGKNVGRRDLYT